MSAIATLKTILSENAQMAWAAAVFVIVFGAAHVVAAHQASMNDQRRTELAARCGHVGAAARDDGNLDTCVRPDGVLVAAPAMR